MKKFNGTTWVDIGTPGFSAGVVYYTSLALGGSGTPYVAYQDGGNGNKATVMKFNGTIWVDIDTPGFSAGQADYTSLAFKNSKLYIAYNSGGAFAKTFSLNTAAPTDITLSATAIYENVAANSTVGTLTSIDIDTGDMHTYTLVSGAGSTDNASFNISGNALRINNSPDYETQNSYSIRIRTTDSHGLFFEKAFTINIVDVYDSPTITSFTPTSGPVGSIVTITGTNFTATTNVLFDGSVRATTLTVNSATQITATVPAGAVTGFLIVVGNSPYWEYSDDIFIVTTPITITTDPISPTSFCAGSNVTVPFTATGPFASGNVFTAQLSDASGSFTSPTTIGTVTATTSGNISATMPAAQTAGAGYRIRVIASNPATTGTDNGSNLTVMGRIATPIATASRTALGQWDNATLTVSNPDPNATYT
ncbi:IPT/TIG domain-containing protein [Adhaeribacter soli]|uniref:Cadherin domain-containing protein n=1 Tax=Adhaeribacter soli TaxID=2607655 RepID=A0A5N1IN05_9BACT|nr:IPT/TIG domain-containing protein [Adhaeribacter soli]KAA9331108.1 hypothetical protein F0P94_14500 [Adhaeribacter soli]